MARRSSKGSVRKLLHIFPTFGLGGQQRRLVDLINAIGADLTHDIISLSEDCEAGDLIKDQAQTRIRTLLLAKGGFFNIENIRRLQSEFVRSNPDYLCTYNWGSIEAVFAWHLSRRNLKKSRSALAHLHFEDGFGPDETIEQQNIKRVMLRRMALRQSLTIVPSTTLEWLAHERWKLPADRIRRIGNGIDLDRFFHPERAFIIPNFTGCSLFLHPNCVKLMFT